MNLTFMFLASISLSHIVHLVLHDCRLFKSMIHEIIFKQLYREKKDRKTDRWMDTKL